ncbi:TetR/AcrR family transcriptional regulator [Hoeflea sp. G2-23]|uniref:TetR/AcrR family transcriptional regulator n=1 Tax=Hoeflea algicola TaxID=2983763 RepID=A0ABT3Z9A6_9HYPH|nr:TetR family transcriptional regulator C-terminal domain-containing protein [Hoeflea algicola]MCY0147919.1 TetR/AcrR family transcriptional regulator [Hoeflea algicola]
MKSSTKTDQSKSEQTRARILAEGRALVLAHGFGGLGLTELLAASAVPKGSFYYYFASKEAFGCAMLEQYVADYLAALDAIIASPEPAAARMDRFFATALASDAGSMADRCLVVKLAAEIADLSEAMRTILNDGVCAVCQRLARLLREGAEDGSIIPRPDPDMAAGLLYSQWLGAAIIAKLSRDPGPLQQALDDTRHRFFV